MSSNIKLLSKYYARLLMSIDMFSSYQGQARSLEQRLAYEQIISLYEQFQLQIAHTIEAENQVPPQTLRLLQQLSDLAHQHKIKKIPSDKQLWHQSRRDYMRALTMMKKFIAKNRHELSAYHHKQIMQQMHDTYALGQKLGLIARTISKL